MPRFISFDTDHPGITKGREYLDSNGRIVDDSGELVALPCQPASVRMRPTPVLTDEQFRIASRCGLQACMLLRDGGVDDALRWLSSRDELMFDLVYHKFSIYR